MPSGHPDSRRAIVAALAANLGIAILKFVAFLVTQSSSMLSESIHSVADTGNQGLLLIGRARALRPADEQHPFGYGSVRYFYSFVVAFVLFSLGGVFSMFEGVDKLRHPHELESAVWRDCRFAPRSGKPTRSAPRASRGGGSSATPRVPTCRSCSSRTRRHLSASSSR
jgi:hypothetical protein